jgi:hypothetical protein
MTGRRTDSIEVAIPEIAEDKVATMADGPWNKA